MTDTINLRQRIQRLVRTVDPSGLHNPIFGAQRDRFEDVPNSELPPPGAYEVDKSFRKVQSRGRIANGALSSKSKRVIFKGATN